MRARHFVLPAILAAVAPLATPVSAAPACVMAPWRNGQTCTFEAPLRAIAFGGVSSTSQGPDAWVAVEVVLNGVVLASCYDPPNGDDGSAACAGTFQPFAPNATHVCRVYGRGGPKAHCADPPVLPVVGAAR
ncbi:MAG TPA: hypothetical protein VNA20_06700 [Frankiaceae bacterium]|nr:hypothetical protein [Frankiaceae bacterium]